MISTGLQFSLSFSLTYITIMLVNIARLKIAIKKLSMWFSAFMSLIMHEYTLALIIVYRLVYD